MAEVSAGGVELAPVRLVDPDGSPTAEDRYSRDLPPETLSWLYELMVVTRDLDTRIHQPATPGRAGAVRVMPRPGGRSDRGDGVPAQDRLVVPPVPRDRRVPAARHHTGPDGCRLAGQVARWARIHREVLRADLDSRSARTDLHAVGAAMGAQRLGEDSVTLAFLGDGATSEGDAHEALNFAAVFKAPCVFFVQNNQWAISTPVSHQMAAPSIAHRAIGYGMPGIRVDGNDVLACYAVTAEAAARARDGGGPTLIEAITYRMGPHTTSDDPTRYRSQDEVDHWSALDPIARYRNYLQAAGVWTERLEERVAAKSKRLRTELRESVVGADDFDVAEMFDTVYHDITPDLAHQREQLLAELAKEA